jgi:steroid 5-alpha reductase family enzyme
MTTAALSALAGLLLLFAATWLASWRLRNAGIVDVVWSFAFTPVVLAYAMLGTGFMWRRILVATLVTAWSLRLTMHLFRRVRAHHPEEDSRYAALRESWGPAAERRMFGFFQLQGVLVAVLSLPFLLACWNPAPHVHPLEITGAVLWFVALAGEAAADAQLAQFKADPAHRGAVCRAGWWRYSRHPNYFFEWLVWVAFCLVALPAPWGWTTALSPLLMLHFLVNVTGVKYSEEQSLKRRGDAYREYQRTTSAFIPWFPRA